MVEKVTSIRIDKELWKKARILAIKRGIVLKNIVEELLSNEVKGEDLMKKIHVSEEQVKKLQDRLDKAEIPFVISINETAVQLVREGRGR